QTLIPQRETFNYLQNDSKYGEDIDTADAWIEAGWNVGIFYWNQFADEDEVKNAETKIHTAEGPQRMRWRRCDGTWVEDGSPTISASELFYESYVAALADYQGTNIRVVGHSLGNQMATVMARHLQNHITAGEAPAYLMPTRIALLDPFWSNWGKSYLGGDWPGEVARDDVRDLIETSDVIFERYTSSNIGGFILVGDENAKLSRDIIGNTEYIPRWTPNTAQGERHVAAPFMYFDSFAHRPPEGCFELPPPAGGRNCDLIGPSAATSDELMREMMNGQYRWRQHFGEDTPDGDDNRFERTDIEYDDRR
ncbi:MAG: hypothetical protein AAGC55_09000, partial [Myxococcota bacterium]